MDDAGEAGSRSGAAGHRGERNTRKGRWVTMRNHFRRPRARADLRSAGGCPACRSPSCSTPSPTTTLPSALALIVVFLCFPARAVFVLAPIWDWGPVDLFRLLRIAQRTASPRGTATASPHIHVNRSWFDNGGAWRDCRISSIRPSSRILEAGKNGHVTILCAKSGFNGHEVRSLLAHPMYYALTIQTRSLADFKGSVVLRVCNCRSFEGIL